MGANALSANRAFVCPAIAGAEPELANWGVYPSGCTPLFFVGRVSSGGWCLCPRKGNFSGHPAQGERWLKVRCILIFFRNKLSSLTDNSRGRLLGTARFGPAEGRRAEEAGRESGCRWISSFYDILQRGGVNDRLEDGRGHGRERRRHSLPPSG